MPIKPQFLGKDTEHVFEVELQDFEMGIPVTAWLPAYRCLIDGEEQLVHAEKSVYQCWLTAPKLVRIDDISHLLNPVQLAEMKQV